MGLCILMWAADTPRVYKVLQIRQSQGRRYQLPFKRDGGPHIVPESARVQVAAEDEIDICSCMSSERREEDCNGLLSPTLSSG